MNTATSFTATGPQRALVIARAGRRTRAEVAANYREFCHPSSDLPSRARPVC